jgi:hypothetical protein
LKRGPLWALLGAMAVGCPGVPLRPDGSPADEKCPAGAREALAALDLAPGASVSVFADVTRKSLGLPLILYDGPIESETLVPMVNLPGGTRLQGRVWTSGPRIVIRYYSARLPDGKSIPFCAVAADNGPGLPKAPSRPGGAAIEGPTAEVYVTGQFH